MSNTDLDRPSTPRTDACYWDNKKQYGALLELARQLERELNQALHAQQPCGGGRLRAAAQEALIPLAAWKLTDESKPYKEVGPNLRHDFLAAHDKLLAALAQPSGAASAGEWRAGFHEGNYVIWYSPTEFWWIPRDMNTTDQIVAAHNATLRQSPAVAWKDLRPSEEPWGVCRKVQIITGALSQVGRYIWQRRVTERKT